MNKKEQKSFDDVNGLALRNSVWGLFGRNVKPFKVFFLLAFLGVMFSIISYITFNTALLPAGLFMITAAGPFAFMAYIHNKTRCLNSMVSEMVLTTFFVGGALSLMVGGGFDSIIMKLSPDYIALSKAKNGVNSSPEVKKVLERKALSTSQDICSARQAKLSKPTPVKTKVDTIILLVGFFEEGAKLVFPLLMLLLVPLSRRNVSIGLGLGALTALGFAVLESLYYGFSDFPSFDDLAVMFFNCPDTVVSVLERTNGVLLFRDLTTPFGHLAWTGTATIIIWYLIGSNKSTFMKVLLSVGIYLVVSVLHSLNDFFLLNASIPGYSTLMLSAYAAEVIISLVIFYLSMRLAVFNDRPVSIQIWEKLNP